MTQKKFLKTSFVFVTTKLQLLVESKLCRKPQSCLALEKLAVAIENHLSLGLMIHSNRLKSLSCSSLQQNRNVSKTFLRKKKFSKLLILIRQIWIEKIYTGLKIRGNGCQQKEEGLQLHPNLKFLTHRGSHIIHLLSSLTKTPSSIQDSLDPRRHIWNRSRSRGLNVKKSCLNSQHFLWQWMGQLITIHYSGN